jgi:glycerol-3-phosphate dehydrogenase
VFSKGVYLAFPRNGENEARVLPMHGRDDVLTHVPWGPVMMWGPTETVVRDPEEGLAPDRDDIRFLLDQARHRLDGRHGAEDVVSIRCGVRPLAVPRNFNRDVYPLSLSRRHQVVVHRDRNALTLYGGKLTSSMAVAEHAADLLARWVPPAHPPPAARDDPPETRVHDTLGHAFVTPEWARDREFCVTLDDYLRRRTNIAQWTPRMGLGHDGGRRDSLRETAATLTGDPQRAEEMVNAYEQHVRSSHDPLLAV